MPGALHDRHGDCECAESRILDEILDHPMTSPSPTFRSTAERLILDAAKGRKDAAEIAGAAEHVFQRLHDHLATLIGATGFRALLARSIKLARPGARALEGIELQHEGTLAGLAVAPSFREDFRESLYRTIATLTATGITVMMTVDVLQSFTDLRFSPHEISFLADNLIIQRYVEMEGQIQRALAVLKMRGSAHDNHLRLYTISSDGIHIGPSLEGYRGILTGVPGRLSNPAKR